MPYVGEIRMFAGNFAPLGWMLCQGQLMPISENEPLFNLIGTTYGGDGQDTFGLPNLAGRVPLCMGPNNAIGSMGGDAAVTLDKTAMPNHKHAMVGTADPATTSVPSGMVPATLSAAGTVSAYGNSAPIGAIDPGAVKTEGESLPHENRQPYVAIGYIIAVAHNDIYPPRN